MVDLRWLTLRKLGHSPQNNKKGEDVCFENFEFFLFPGKKIEEEEEDDENSKEEESSME